MADPATPDVNAERSNGDGIDADIRAAIATHTEAPAPVETPPAETAAAAEQRARDELGRFAPRDPTAPAETAAKTSPVEKVAAPKPQAEGQAPDPAAAKTEEQQPGELKAPERWPALRRQQFESLPDEGKAALLSAHKDMEAHFTRSMMAINDFKRDYEPVAKVVEPYRQQLRENGQTPESLIGAYINVERALHASPESAAQTIANAIKHYRVDPGLVAQILGGQAPQGQQADPQGYTDPQMSALEQRVAAQIGALQQGFQGITTHLTGWAGEQERQRNAALLNDINSFGATKTAEGQLAHPYLNDEPVLRMMTALARAAQQGGGEIPPLKDLYESAVYSLPDYRSRLLGDEQQARESKRQEADRTRALAARSAAVSVTGAPASGPAPVANSNSDDLRATILESYNQHAGAA